MWGHRLKFAVDFPLTGNLEGETSCTWTASTARNESGPQGTKHCPLEENRRVPQTFRCADQFIEPSAPALTLPASWSGPGISPSNSSFMGTGFAKLQIQAILLPSILTSEISEVLP